MIALYSRTLDVVLRFRVLTLLVLLATIALTVHLYIKTPKGYFPQDDTGLIFGSTRASPDISFKAMIELQQQAADIVLADPAVAGVGSSIGTSGWNPSVNRGQMFISLKPLSERGVPTQAVINRLRPKLLNVGGMRVFMVAAQDVRIGGRQSSSQYQFTLWGSNIDELQRWVAPVLERMQTLPELVDVNTDREQGGLQANVVIDRVAASRLGVKVQDINNALNNAFAQRQISTIYTRAQPIPRHPRDRSALSARPVRPRAGLCGRRQRNAGPALGRDQDRAHARAARGQPPGTIPGGHHHLQPRAGRDHRARDAKRSGRRSPSSHLPDSVQGDFAGDARQYARTVGAQPLLIAGGADRGLHHPRRALRKPRPSADDHLDLAVGRPRRAARAARCSTPSSR